MKAAGTQSSGGVTPQVSTPKLKRASLEGEPARKRRRGEPRPAEAATEPPADSETDVSDGMLSQAATQPTEPLTIRTEEPKLRGKLNRCPHQLLLGDGLLSLNRRKRKSECPSRLVTADESSSLV